MSNGWWDESEVEATPSKGNLPAVPEEFSEAELYRVPERLTAGWIERQIPKSVWKESRSKLNPHLILSMAEDAGKGISKRAIMARAGYSVNTWHAWVKRAAAGEPVYELWYKCILFAASSKEAELIEKVDGAATSDWRAAKWLLEQINKEEYAEATGNLTVNVDNSKDKTTINSISDNNAVSVAKILQELGVAGGDVVDGEVVEDEDA